jgi:hypothetical protein
MNVRDHHLAAQEIDRHQRDADHHRRIRRGRADRTIRSRRARRARAELA